MQHLGENIKELQSNVELWKHIPGLVESAHDILSRSKEAVESTAQRLILENLYVGDMTRRFDEVERAHEKTYSWLLGSETPHTTTSGSDSIDEPYFSLINWLAYGGGIFHISGKPGAGKSTLMKYLCQSPATKSYLKDWAGEKTLISANFFFWKLGSTTQKSLNGLLRALSYSILEQVPALLATVFPRQWRNATQGKAFRIHNLFSSHKIAIFIDGLDEFDGDHDKMIKLLRSWTEIVPEDVKLCVSSREWEIFRQRLINCPGIRLQDITCRDIEAYINSELSDNEEFMSHFSEESSAKHIIDQIKHKAEGVFLWVKITLIGLKSALLCGERLGDLEARLESLPGGLEELFMSIFTSIRSGTLTNKLDRMRAMRMILLTLKDSEIGWFTDVRDLLLTDFWFLDCYDKDPNFAINLPITTGTTESWVSRQDRARRSVYQRCMGLLEI
ncbi:hypothetical protein BDP55DRAFT_561640, partial [Colletotrichum godetiae]